MAFFAVSLQMFMGQETEIVLRQGFHLQCVGGSVFPVGKKRKINERATAGRVHLIDLSLKMIKILAVGLKCICSQMSTFFFFFFCTRASVFINSCMVDVPNH